MGESYSVEAYLKATDNGLISTFKQATTAVETFQDKSNSIGNAVGKGLMSIGGGMTKFVTLPVLAAGTAAVKTGGDFEEGMSRVEAISGATGNAIEKLRNQAISLGADTKFSAKEATGGMENLASAGFEALEIFDAMPGTLDLAAVSGGDVALAAENAATAVRGFNLDASETGHVADVFARAAADTNAEVRDMGDAMKYVAPVANAMKISLEETAAAIGIMSDAGIKGSQAGTTLRGALSRIAKPTEKMLETMDALGISFYDANGQMKPLEEQVRMLKTSMSGLTDEQQQNALVTLYGQESLSGMLALISAGPDKLNALTSSLRNSDGAAAEMAATMQDNMNSSVEQMLGAFESAAIIVQDLLSPAIRNAADFIGGLVQKFIEAPPATQKLILAIIGLVAGLGPLLFIVGKAMTSFASLKVAIGVLSGGTITTLGGAFAAVGTKIGAFATGALGMLKTGALAAGGALKALWGLMLANPVTLIIAGIVLLVGGFILLWNKCEGFRNFWIGLWGNIKSVFFSFVAFVQTIPEKIGQFVQSIGDFFATLPERIGFALGYAIASIGLWVYEMGTKAIEAGTTFVTNVATFFATLPERIKEALTMAAFHIGLWVYETGMKAIEAGSNFINNVVTFFQTLPERVKNFLTETALKVGLFAVNLAQKGREAATNLVNNIINGIKGLPGKVAEIGRNIVQGIWNGITGAAGWIRDKVAGFAKGILDGMKAALGIHSPSKEAEDEVGAQLPAGVAVGVMKNMGTAMNAVKSMNAALFGAVDVPNFDVGARLSAINGKAKSLIQHKVAGDQNDNTIYQFDIEIPLDGETLVKKTIRYTAEQLEKLKQKVSTKNGRKPHPVMA